MSKLFDKADPVITTEPPKINVGHIGHLDEEEVKTVQEEETAPKETPKPVIITREYKKYFTSGKPKTDFDIIGTSLEPSPTTMLGGKFKEKYTLQIESLIFNGTDKIDPDDILPILTLTAMIRDNDYPIRLKSKKHIRLSSQITDVVNDYFNTHLANLLTILGMFEGTFANPFVGEENAGQETTDTGM